MFLVDGYNPFGIAVNLTEQENDRESQMIAAPGLDGILSLDMGGRGVTGTITGFAWSNTTAQFYIGWRGLQRLQDGRSHVLVDTYLGRTWNRVKFHGLKHTNPNGKFPMRGVRYNICSLYEIQLQILDYQEGR